MKQRSVKDIMFDGADEEIRVLRSKLRMAMQGEERSRKVLTTSPLRSPTREKVK